MNRLTSLFKDLQYLPDSSLEGRVLLALVEERRRFVVSSRFAFLGVLVSGVAFLGMAGSFGQGLLRSEFWSLLMLVFSDMGIVVSASRDFAYSLLETLPLLPLIGIIFPLTLFFFSLSLLFSLDKKGIGLPVASGHSSHYLLT